MMITLLIQYFSQKINIYRTGMKKFQKEVQDLNEILYLALWGKK